MTRNLRPNKTSRREAHIKMTKELVGKLERTPFPPSLLIPVEKLMTANQ